MATLVFAWAAYRSVAVAVTTGEAFAYNHFVSQPLLQIVSAPWNENNQILNSLLCHWLLRLFRLSEWSFRLAGLLGLIVYFAASFRLCKVACKSVTFTNVAVAVFIINPFTVGWLPVSSGHWMAAGLLLFALAFLLRELQGPTASSSLILPSCLLGLGTGFHSSFFLPSVGVLLLICHLNFWEVKSFGFWQGLNQFVLPFLLICFCLWSLPLLNAQTFSLPESAFVVLLPGLAVLSIPWLAADKWVWQCSGGLLVLVLGLCLLKVLPLADHFHIGREAAMPKVARALRDHLRRSEVRAVRLKTSDELLESANFYRRRYALGAVEAVRRDLPASAADFYILAPADPLRNNPNPSHRIFAFRGIELFEK